MTVENLISTMNADPYSLFTQMQIDNDAIIINQCNNCSYESVSVNNYNLKMFSLPEKGIGLSRNTALIRATADIIIFSDDDMVYVDGYRRIIEKTYNDYPYADIIIFNIYENSGNRFLIKRSMRIRWYNFMRFGCARITCKRESVIKKRISFSTKFGGGSKYGSGEDTIFLHDCLKKGLKIIAVPIYIAKLKEERASTWFKGYNEKFYFDKGALFEALNTKFSLFYILQFALRRYNGNLGPLKVLKIMLRGKREYKEIGKAFHE